MGDTQGGTRVQGTSTSSPSLCGEAGIGGVPTSLGSAASAHGQSLFLLEKLEGTKVFLLLSWI